MLFGRRGAIVAAPVQDAAQTGPDAVATQLRPDEVLKKLRPDHGDRQSDRVIELERALGELVDEVVWIKERYLKLQTRVTTELREIRREVDRYREEGWDDGDDDEQG